MNLKICVLFSGGKDSSLAAFILSKIFEIELITVTFGILKNWRQASKVAGELKFPWRIINLDQRIIEEASKIVINDGYPNNGIKYIHKKVLEEMAKNSNIIADGVRRNDVVPKPSLPEIMSLEDRFKVHYIQPLIGYSRKTIDLLLRQTFLFKEYEGESFPGAQYEFELRELIKKEYGPSKIDKIFPKHHTHSIVIGMRV